MDANVALDDLDDVAHAGLHAAGAADRRQVEAFVAKLRQLDSHSAACSLTDAGEHGASNTHLLQDDFRTFPSIYKPTKQNDAHRAERLHSGENSTWGEKWQEQEKPEQGLREQATAGAGVR